MNPGSPKWCVSGALCLTGKVLRAASVFVCVGLFSTLGHGACNTTYTLVAGSSASLVGTPLSACTISGSTITCTQDVTVSTNNLCILTTSSSMTIAVDTSTFNWAGNNGVLGSSTNPINLNAQSINVDGQSFTSYGNWTATGTLNCNTNAQTALNGTVSGSPNNCTAYIHAATQNCLTDTFAGGTLDTSVWNVSGVGYTPRVVTSPAVTSNRLRLTDAVGYEATFAQFKKWFPGAGNKVVVEFDYYVWGGNGADGLSVVLSDASVPPTPGASGGSLGYAQKSGVNGFGGGWLGIALDEFGNFPNNNEGRNGYPSGWVAPAGANFATRQYANSVSVRGSGSAATGFFLLATSGSLTPKLWQSSNTSATTQRFRITVDHSNSLNAYVSVDRDLTGTGNSYTSIIPPFDVRATNSGQAAVPTNMMLSFTGGTGGSTNNHEIANVRVCATAMNPVGGAVAAANFECMDGYLTQASYNNRQTTPAARNPIYTKLARTGFNLRVVPLAADGSFQSSYIPAGGSSKNVTVEIFDASASVPATCSAYSAGNLVATQTVTLASGVNFLTNNFTVNKAYTKLMCRVTDNNSGSPVYGCSSDQFAVRPGDVTLSTIPTMATPPSASAAGTVKAGAAFTLRASTSTSSTDAYSGALSQVSSPPTLTAQTTAQDTTQVSGGVVGSLSPSSLTANASTTGNASYGEVGYLYLAAGAYSDTSFTTVDQVGDCVSASTSTTLSSGKYGCVIGNTAVVSLGRFVPDHFVVTPAPVVPGCGSSFTYFGQDGVRTPFTITAQNSANATTQNYTGSFAKFITTNYASYVFTGSGLPTGVSFGTGATAPSGTWSSGVASVTATHLVARPNAPVIPASVTFSAAPVDTDGVTVAVPTAVNSAAATFDYGRVRLLNANGSELLNLPLTVRLEYWQSAANGWQVNSGDTCTAITASNFAFAFGGTGNNMNACKTALTLAGTAPNYALTLARPGSGNNGWADITLNLGATATGNTCTAVGGSSPAATTANAPWLQFNWTGTVGNPKARATFGVYKSGPVIHRRELY